MLTRRLPKLTPWLNQSTLLTLVWILMLIAGLVVTTGYDHRAGTAADAPRSWPQGASIEPNHDGSTIVMVAHPKCFCTRASIAELALIMAHSNGQAKAIVLFIRPVGFDPDWERTDIWRSATAIPGVTAISDPDGKEASMFGAATSGQMYIYDKAGRLVFDGGITESRGHEGENANLDAALSAVHGQDSLLSTTAVYGCPLRSPHDKQVSRK